MILGILQITLIVLKFCHVIDWQWWQVLCSHKKGLTIGVYGNGTNSWHRTKHGRNFTIAEMREAMQINWMTRDELTQAIPPAYTKWIGERLLEQIAK
jgi:hypothetical protein